MKTLYRAVAAGLFAAVAATSAAKADPVILSFTGVQTGAGEITGDNFEDPNGNTSQWGAYSGSVSWDPDVDPSSLSFNVNVDSSPYGNLQFSGPAGFVGITNGQMTAQLDVDIAPSSQPFVVTIQVDSSAFTSADLPSFAALNGTITSVVIGNDNGADSDYPVSSEADSFALSTVPEPSPIALLGLGLCALGLMTRRKNAGRA